ncbi:FliI/YscN family ATPase [Brevundimonas faecalis]|uniref:Flagellum-specific ATP synthase n=1 Tax=Brevundimonas faecalis TaxID=947378 RepID=A0ABV2R989_9CAUL
MSLAAAIDAVRAFSPAIRQGRVTRAGSTFLEADGPDAPVGALCMVEQEGRRPAAAVVSSVRRDRVVLAPLDAMLGVRLGARVVLEREAVNHTVGDALAGRAVDGLGRPIDGGPPIIVERRACASSSPSPLDRHTPSEIVETGVRAIDGLLTLGRGQRIGLFAAPGVGKTTLLTQLARHVEADRVVICLVGERGREVEALWADTKASGVRSRCVLVAATSDESAALRAQAVELAMAQAVAWRADGLHVLLLVDSATRYAMALREIGLAAGEPPTVRAYTPNVFAALPRLVEACGAVRNGGAVTAVMTVLSETDDVDDPVSEVMRSLLDGHIVLSRRLAEQGRFPAIDAPRSLSRLASGLRSAEHQAAAERASSLIAEYEQARPLLDAGMYTAGANADIDAAIERRADLTAFLSQRTDERSSLKETMTALATAARLRG